MVTRKAIHIFTSMATKKAIHIFVFLLYALVIPGLFFTIFDTFTHICPVPSRRLAINFTVYQASSTRTNQYSACDTEDAASRYLTLSREGMLNVWSLEWQLQKSMIFEGNRSNPKSAWFTDLVCMTNCNLIVVASTDYEMSFYSITSNLIQKKFQIKGKYRGIKLFAPKLCTPNNENCICVC